MELLPSEVRERHAYIDLAIEEFRSNLANQQVQLALGRKTTRSLIEVADLLYVPNVNHSEITISQRDIKSNKVPILAVNPGDVYIYDKSFTVPTPRQIASMIRFAGEIDETGSLDPGKLTSTLTEAHIKTATRLHHRLKFPEKTHGCVKTASSDIDIKLNSRKELFFVEGRPLVMLRYDDWRPGHTTLSHEAAHIVHIMDKNVTLGGIEGFWDEIASQELEAYHRERDYTEACAPEYAEDSILIDDIRRQLTTAGDPYQKSDALMLEIKTKTGLDLNSHLNAA